MNTDFNAEFRLLAKEYTKLQAKPHKTAEEKSRRRHVKKIFHELSQNERNDAKRTLRENSLPTDNLKAKWTAINHKDYQFQNPKHSLVRRIKNIFHLRIRKKELITEAIKPVAPKELAIFQKSDSSESSSSSSLPPPPPFKHFLNYLNSREEPLSARILIDFFTKNRAEIALLASKNPLQWLDFSKDLKDLLLDEDNKIGQLLNQLDFNIATKLGIQAHYYSPLPAKEKNWIQDLPDDILGKIVAPQANKKRQRKLTAQQFIQNVDKKKLFDLWLKRTQDTIERMKVLYKACPNEESVFGSIKLEKFLEYVKTNKIPILAVVTDLNDVQALLFHMKNIDFSDSQWNVGETGTILKTASSNIDTLHLNCLHIDYLNHLSHPESIQTLTLDLDHINEGNLEKLSLLTHLKSLRLKSEYRQHENLEDLFKIIGTFKNLQVLNLSNTLLFPKGFQYLKTLVSLRALNLGDCFLQDTDYEILKHFTNLEELRLANCNIKDQNLISIQFCKKLERLDLSSSYFSWITDAGLEALQNLPLIFLSLKDQAINGIGFKYLPTSLAQIDLRGVIDPKNTILEHKQFESIEIINAPSRIDNRHAQTSNFLRTFAQREEREGRQAYVT